MTIRIGISGWRYAPWRGTFHPEKLQQRRELEYASGVFPSIEINGSFYSLQSPKSRLTWHDEAPSDFVFAVKAPRYSACGKDVTVRNVPAKPKAEPSRSMQTFGRSGKHL